MINFIIRKIESRDEENSDKIRQNYALVSSVIGIVLNIILSVCKMICGIVFNTISVLSDGVNNLSDAGSAIVTLVGFKISEKPADKEHPFGHARMEYVSGLLVSFIILYVGIELLITSFKKIINPNDLFANEITIVVLAISIIVKLWLYFFNKKIGEKINSVTVLGIAKDSINDVFITLGVIASLAVYGVFNINLDGYVGLILAVLIISSGISIAKETLSKILGEAPSDDFVQGIYKGIREYEYVLGVHDFVVHSYGHGRYFVSAHVEFDSTLEFLLCHEISDKIERDFEKKGINIVVHIDPVAVNCEVSDKYKEITQDAVNIVDTNLSMHDFRVVITEDIVNVVFDIVIPLDKIATEEEICDRIKIEAKKRDPKIHCIIHVDKYHNINLI